MSPANWTRRTRFSNNGRVAILVTLILGPLALNHNLVGQYDQAVTELQQALHINPNNSSCYLNLIANYAALNRVEDATATYNAALARKLDHPLLHANRYGVAFLSNDPAEMQRQMASIAAKRDSRTFCFPSSRTRRRTPDIFERSRTLPASGRLSPAK